jgi:hypothetical protein
MSDTPIKWSRAPRVAAWGEDMVVADIELDRDHTLTLYCEADQTAKVNAMFAEIEALRAAAQTFVQDYENGDMGDLKHYARAMRAALAKEKAF